MEPESRRHSGGADSAAPVNGALTFFEVRALVMSQPLRLVLPFRGNATHIKRAAVFLAAR
jgi:hypothetical protein